MEKFKELLKSKSITQIIIYGILLAGIVADIIFIAVDVKDITFSIGCFLFILLGSIVGLADFFFEFRGIFGWVASLMYAVAIGFHMNVALPSISDLWNKVNFIGGNQEIAIAFGIIFLALETGLIVLNFFENSKKQINHQ